jgi:hypothetical protein
MAHWNGSADDMFPPFSGEADLLVAEVIALQLTVNSISAGKTGLDIYRPTIIFAGSMILGGGLILIVQIPYHVH